MLLIIACLSKMLASEYFWRVFAGMLKKHIAISHDEIYARKKTAHVALPE